LHDKKFQTEKKKNELYLVDPNKNIVAMQDKKFAKDVL
jgi:hypothetical protein